MSNQQWDPDRYARNARFVADLGMPVVELLAPQSGERILDLGCGDGPLTEKIAALGVDVIGVDSSAEQIEAAQARGLDARVADGQALTFRDEFDAVFSNAALHWMRDPNAVIDGVWTALRAPGRFVGEFGGSGNVEIIRTSLKQVLARRGVDGERGDPWFFPTPDDYRARLERRGFQVRSIELIPRPTPLPGEMVAWLETFAEDFAALLPAQDRAGYLEEVAEGLRPALYDGDGRWTADYVRLRFAADKPAS